MDPSKAQIRPVPSGAAETAGTADKAAGTAREADGGVLAETAGADDAADEATGALLEPHAAATATKNKKTIFRMCPPVSMTQACFHKLFSQSA